MKNNKSKHPKKINTNKQEGKPPKIQYYESIVASLPVLGQGVWLIGGFILFAYAILNVSPFLAILAALLPTIYATFKKS